MKVAIFHGSFDIVGGGEKVALLLARHWNADIITTRVSPSLAQMTPPGTDLISVGKNPGFVPLNLIAKSFLFNRVDLSEEYDFFFLNGAWTQFAARHHKPNFWYCRRPPAIFYSERERLLQTLPVWKRILGRVWIAVHRRWERQVVEQVDSLVCNSKSSQRQIRQHYDREAPVVYLPVVGIEDFHCKDYDGYWLSVNRLVPFKRIELQLDLFRALPDEELKIVGGRSSAHTEYWRQLSRNVPANVQFIGEKTGEELIELYANSKGFISTSRYETFGVALVEAMASGKAVVTTARGGPEETIIQGETGFRVSSDIDDILDAMRMVAEDPERFKESCQERAHLFTEKNFLDRIDDMTDGILDE